MSELELDARRREMDEAHRWLDDVGVPREVDGFTLSLPARIRQVTRLRQMETPERH